MPAYYEEVSKIVKQAREVGLTCPILGSDGWDSPKLVEIAGADALNNTYFSSAYSAQDQDPTIQNSSRLQGQIQCRTGQLRHP